jgi:tRNA-Thr(GGU) m(6)t(6)A37 methyltransferase TsaA
MDSSSGSVAFTSIAMFLSQVLVCEYLRIRRDRSDIEEAYWAERRGRARVEQEMRNLADIQLNTSEGFFVQPIATIESCYRQCVGTPRQGILVPASRARVILASNMSPEALDGLEQFSHVWLTFKFHMNTNTLKNARAFDGVVNDTRKYTFIAKITPPMLKKKVGVLATRSPHRPNPIGVTLAKIEAVSKATRTVTLSCCDLVHGTPILDIKPYVPSYDNVYPFTIPQWIEETIDTRNEVRLHESVTPDLIATLSPWLDLYRDDCETFLRGLLQTLEAEVRSKFQTSKRMDETERGIYMRDSQIHPVDISFYLVF